MHYRLSAEEMELLAMHRAKLDAKLGNVILGGEVTSVEITEAGSVYVAQDEKGRYSIQRVKQNSRQELTTSRLELTGEITAKLARNISLYSPSLYHRAVCL